MKFEINIAKKRYIFIAILLSFYASFGMSLNLGQTNPSTVLEKFTHNTWLTRLYAYIIISLRHKSGVQLMYAGMALLVFVLWIMAFSQKYHFIELIVDGLMALCFGGCQWLGVIYSNGETWNPYIANKYLLLKDFLYITSWAVLMMAVILVLTTVVKNVFPNYSIEEWNRARSVKKKLWIVFLISLVIIIVCWLPYYIIFWPGSMHGDVPGQILQYYHYPVSFQNRWITDGVNTLYSNDHPFIMTMFLGFMLDFGIMLGDAQIGIAIYTALQMICFALACAFMVATLYHFCVRKTLVKMILVIYALFPIFPMYAQLIGGDSSLALIFLWFMSFLIWIYQTNGEILRSKKFMAAEFFIIFLMGAVKNQGIYIAVVCIFFTLILCHKFWKRLLICMVLPVFVFYIGYQGILFSVCHVGSVGKQEALSFFFQQTARYVKYDGDEVTKEEKEAIDAVLEYDVLAKKYDRNLSDYVKKTYRKDVTGEELKNYFITWFHMGLKHPLVYVEAFFGNTWQYYCPSHFKDGSYYYKLSTMRYFVLNRKKMQKIVPQTFVDQMSFHVSDEDKENREIAYSYLNLTKYVPGLNWLLIPGCVTWLMLTGFLCMWVKKNYKMMILFLPVFLVFGVCLLSPSNGNVRYLFPAYGIVPVMFCMALGGGKRKDEKQDN